VGIERPSAGRAVALAKILDRTSRSPRSKRSSNVFRATAAGHRGLRLLAALDRITKSRLYARHGIPEYWIVNVADEVVEVHLEPAGDAWASRTVHGAGTVLTPHALPGVTVVVDELLAFMVGRP